MPFPDNIVRTAGWNARPATQVFPRTHANYVVVHHTTSPNPPNTRSGGTVDGGKSYARQVQADHMDHNHWSDSGHNFLVTVGGHIMEGRHGTVDAIMAGQCVRSAHAAQDPGRLAFGNNSPGIENEGNFMTHVMEATQWDTLVALCSDLCRKLSLQPTAIRGHREFSNTACPGDWLFSQLPRLRTEVATALGTALPADAAMNAPAGVLVQINDTGPAVLLLQQRLLGAGFSPGDLDGIFGEMTRAALIRFQTQHGLPATGGVDVKTRQALGL